MLNEWLCKPSYLVWDIFHVNLVFFTSFLQETWEMGCVCLWDQDCQVRGHRWGWVRLWHSDCRLPLSLPTALLQVVATLLLPSTLEGSPPTLQEEPQSKHHVYFGHSNLQKRKVPKTMIAYTHTSHAHTHTHVASHVTLAKSAGGGRWVASRMH